MKGYSGSRHGGLSGINEGDASGRVTRAGIGESVVVVGEGRCAAVVRRLLGLGLGFQ